MRIYAYYPDVSSNYHFEDHTDFQDRELKSEQITFNAGFNGGYEKHNPENVKCDVNVKIKTFRVSVFEVCFTNFTNQLACKLRKSQQNLVSKSDIATKTCPTLKKMHLTLR